MFFTVYGLEHLISQHKLRQHYVTFEKFLECEYGLLSELLHVDVITKQEYSRIMACRQRKEQNQELLAVLSTLDNSEKWQQFLQALDASTQKHLACLLGYGSKLLFGMFALCQQQLLRVL